jgi:methyl-accepting chemotaxis protein
MDIERTMEFILQQNATTASRLDRISLAQDRMQPALDKLLKAAESHEKAIEAHEEDLETHTEWLTQLSRAMQELTTNMKAGFAEVAVAQKTTEENLNILIRTAQDILPRIPPTA